MIRVSSKIRSPLQAGQARMARSSSSIIIGPPCGWSREFALEECECASESFVETDLGYPPQTLLGQCRTEAAPSLLARLGGSVSGRHVEPAGPSQRATDLVDRGLDPRADVHAAGDLRTLERAEIGCRDVVEIDVVGRLLSVAVDHRGLSSEEPVTEDRHDAGLA